MNEPLVSIIIPTLNSEKTLERCLKRIKKQTYRNIEIVIVDSFSNDKTIKISKKYVDSVIRTNTLRSEARNIGARKSKGKFLLFIDSDMELTKNVVEECIEKSKENDALIIPEISIGKGFWVKCIALEKSCCIGDNLLEAARFFKRNVFYSVNGYDENLEAAEDWDLNLRIEKNGFKIGRILSFVKHNEGKLTIFSILKKKYHYGKTLNRYIKKHPKQASKQLKIIRPAFLRSWKKLLRNPIYSIGMFSMKFFEFGVAGIGFLANKVKK